ncbi:HET-domain-containing protein [Echria macrotheca]|uniref:HET-domain-containing protein n=1 Tax=Echria macrotheca TaxID=438768 RepID=A0AAJ0B3V5_9PEZI|nr:HET-domain-containing protein [Echria macrotheca]
MMAQVGELCSSCAQIPFENLQLGEPRNAARFELDPWERVQASTCPFCQLVSYCVTAKQEVEGSIRQLTSDIVVYWCSNENGRPGFQVGISHAVQILFLSDDEAASHHAVPRALPQRADIHRINGWIETCTKEHSCVIQLPLEVNFGVMFPGLGSLRLVDVAQRCLIETNEPQQYVTLSYVWGSADNLGLTKRNREQLLVPGIFDSIHNHIPRTIRDAIELVRRLGLRYLWVDSLCLIQDDPRDLSQGVNVMDQIYEHAWLTIAAGHGHNANAGLPGVRHGDRVRRNFAHEVKPGLFLGLCESFGLLLSRTLYETRAWTFQERLLSRRVLYFFENSLAFSCGLSIRLEACPDRYPCPKPQDPSFARSLVESPGSEDQRTQTALRDYFRVVSIYSQRALTHDSDILRALAGIMRRFSLRFETSLIQGLPKLALDFSLIFRGTNLKRRSGFPSYSWAGWRGEVNFVRSILLLDGSCDDLRTWIKWYQHAPGEIVPSRVHRSYFTTEITGSFPYHISGVDMSETECGLSGFTSRFSAAHENPPYPLLRFFTLTVSLEITMIDPFILKAELAGTDGTVYSKIELGQEDDDGDQYLQVGSIVELALILGYKHSRGEQYSVLLIKWNGAIAERRGSGYLMESGLLRSFLPGPQWREIVLG